jgi:hypothetical protein
LHETASLLYGRWRRETPIFSSFTTAVIVVVY